MAWWPATFTSDVLLPSVTTILLWTRWKSLSKNRQQMSVFIWISRILLKNRMQSKICEAHTSDNKKNTSKWKKCVSVSVNQLRIRMPSYQYRGTGYPLHKACVTFLYLCDLHILERRYFGSCVGIWLCVVTLKRDLHIESPADAKREHLNQQKIRYFSYDVDLWVRTWWTWNQSKIKLDTECQNQNRRHRRCYCTLGDPSLNKGHSRFSL